MLSELHIENLAVIDAAGLTFHPGLNVISGETGAGKTILAHAISLLLGTRADSGLIRPEAAEASVEAVFTLPSGCFTDLADDIDVPDGEQLAVSRRISRDGRSRAYVGGRTTTLAVLGELTGRLLAFSAQHEQRRLMLASRQLDILDDYAGPELADLLTEYGRLYDRGLEVRARLAGLTQDYEVRERESELLKFQLAEIEAAALASGEDQQLDSERRRLLRAHELRDATAALAAVLAGSEGSESLMDALSQVMSRLENATGVDTELDAITARLRQNFYELEETGRSAREYAEAVQSDPARLAEVEERLDLIGQLHRKYGANSKTAAGGAGGNGIAEIKAYAARAAAKLALLTGATEGRTLLEQELASIEQEMIALAGGIREIRAGSAERLQQEAGRHLSDLAFNDCGFEVRLSPVAPGGETELVADGETEPLADGDAEPLAANSAISAVSLTRTGADSAEFLVRLNPGMPATPLAKTASGGELSRIMLAIKSTVTASRETASLVFDEIDAGIGGETGAAVGAKLKSLGRDSQIICITHLPQIACCADAHFRVVKRTEDGQTMTAVNRLEGEAIVDELCRMMGSRPEDAKARAHAGDLLKNATGSVIA